MPHEVGRSLTTGLLAASGGRTACVGVIGLRYVGLPLALEMTRELGVEVANCYPYIRARVIRA